MFWSVSGLNLSLIHGTMSLISQLEQSSNTHGNNRRLTLVDTFESEKPRVFELNILT